jgi:hypothetical protein
METDHDRNLISLKHDYEVRYWQIALGVTRAELMNAVHEVGHAADRVRRYLAAQQQR